MNNEFYSIKEITYASFLYTEIHYDLTHPLRCMQNLQIGAPPVGTLNAVLIMSKCLRRLPLQRKRLRCNCSFRANAKLGGGKGA